MFSMKNETTTWKNWSESVHCHDMTFIEPNTLEELRTVVKECYRKGRKIRVVGSGHSFTPLAATDDVLISMNQLAGIASINEDGVATVWAGTTLKSLGKLLYKQGYSMENLGDINEQTLAGAIGTGTHGTGSDLGNISSQLKAVTIMTARGNLLEISPDSHPEWLNAVKISLGLLGVIVKVELKVVPVYGLVAESYRLTLEDCYTQLGDLKDNNRNLEFYWFPYTNTVQVKIMNLHHESAHQAINRKKDFFNKVVIVNGLFWVMSESIRIIPPIAKTMSALSALGVPVGKEHGSNYQLYTTPRLVKFQEMEYCIPAEVMTNAMQDIEKVIQRQRFNVHFPIEYRFVKNDDIWLSPSYERDSAYIAVHMYKGMDFHAYFHAMEETFHYYDGRPHWGKMHTMDAPQLKNQYPQLESFLKIRKELDSTGMFVNEYLLRLLDIQ